MFDYRTISQLEAPDAAAALLEPAATQSVEFARDALDPVLAAAGGYPYFLQPYGRAIWDTAPSSPFTAADAAAGIELGRARLDDGVFRARWDRATPSERRLLVAMAEGSDRPSSSSEVAHRMGLKLTSLGPYRAELIAKGLVYSPDHGLLTGNQQCSDPVE